MKKPQILLTNDDGIHSPGLWAAARELAKLGYVTVAAPREQHSGAGRSVPAWTDGEVKPTTLHIGLATRNGPVTLWAVLPLSRCSMGSSPYCSKNLTWWYRALIMARTQPQMYLFRVRSARGWKPLPTAFRRWQSHWSWKTKITWDIRARLISPPPRCSPAVLPNCCSLARCLKT